MAITVFKRHEIKFMTDARQRAFLEQALSDIMVPDAYGESTVCSVYYDTPDYRLIRASMEKPVYKEKLRLRSYGRAGQDDRIFMELKKKYKGIVYKRRIELKNSEAESFLAGETGLPEDSQIGREIEYFREFYKELVPAMYLCYDRTAFFCKTDPGLRITFDRNIRWQTENVSLTAPTQGRQILSPGQSLLEIKVGEAIPLWLVKLLNEADIKQTSFSKYATAYTTLVKEKNITERRALYA